MLLCFFRTSYLVLQSHITESSRGPERSLGRKQDLQDARPDALFAPALLATGHRRPGPKVLGQFTPGRAGSGDPQHACDDQAMISRRASCLRLLWRQEGGQLFEVGRSFGRAVPATGWERATSRAPREPDARGAAHETVWLPPGVDARSARPVESPGLLRLPFAEGVQ